MAPKRKAGPEIEFSGKAANLALLEQLDLFSDVPIQNSVVRDIITQHRPMTAIDMNHPLQFQILTAEDEYLMPNELKLYTKVAITLTKTGGTPENSDWGTNVTMINYALHSMFKQCKLYIGDSEAVLSPQNYSYKAYLEATLGFTYDARRGHMENAGYYSESTKICDTAHDTDNKEGYILQKFSHGTATKREIEFIGRLHLDLSFQGRALLGGTKVKIDLIPNPPEFFLQLNGLNAKVELVDAAIFAHRCKVSQQIVDAHRAALQVSPCKYPITRTEVKEFTIPKDMKSVSLDNCVIGQLPRRVFLCMVKNTAKNGSYDSHPYNFKPFGLNHLAFFLDGHQVPSIAFTPSFTKHQTVRELDGLYEALGQDSTEPSCTIDRLNFENGFAIFGVNFSPDLSPGPGPGSHISEKREGSLRVQLSFNAPLADAISVLLYLEFDSKLMIDENRQLVTETTKWGNPRWDA